MDSIELVVGGFILSILLMIFGAIGYTEYQQRQLLKDCIQHHAPAECVILTK